jgi:DNA-binding XRE family transcriptional regulator
MREPRLLDRHEYQDRLDLLAMILRSYRINAGMMTRLELARILGCTKELVEQYENGEQLPSLDHGTQIVRLFGINHQHFWQGLRHYARRGPS